MMRQSCGGTASTRESMSLSQCRSFAPVDGGVSDSQVEVAPKENASGEHGKEEAWKAGSSEVELGLEGVQLARWSTC